MAKYSYTDKGINFSSLESNPIPKLVIPGKLVSPNDFKYAGEDGIKPVVNAVEIDWNEAVLPNVSLSDLTSYNHVITTGDLLCLINDMQGQINALAQRVVKLSYTL